MTVRKWIAGLFALGGVASIFLFGFGNKPNENLKNDIQTKQYDSIITTGTGLSERFEIQPVNGQRVEPGMLVCIDTTSSGRLRICDSSYDRTVAGVISGGQGAQSGVVMSQPGTLASGSHEVVISGRVYCWVDATQSAVELGDMLTTSEFLGFAMKATDRERALGATVGKSLSELPLGEKGLILVLVSLQ